MQPLLWSQLITLLLTIAVFVILIVVLTRNSLPNSTDAEKITKLDNKVNWLYGLALAESGLLLLSMVIGFIFMTRWFSK
jgi:NADH:ubiquinone oxidoreductase subunit 6 (subunit J)